MADDEITEIIPIAQPPQIRDDPDAPSFFVDWLCGAGPLGANFSMTFGAIQFDHGVSGPDHRYIRSKLRLTVPIEQARVWAEGILRLLNEPPPAEGSPPVNRTLN